MHFKAYNVEKNNIINANNYLTQVQSVVGKQSKNWVNLQPRESVTDNSKQQRTKKVEKTSEKNDENEDAMTATESKENEDTAVDSDEKERSPVR